MSFPDIEYGDRALDFANSILKLPHFKTQQVEFMRQNHLHVCPDFTASLLVLLATRRPRWLYVHWRLVQQRLDFIEKLNNMTLEDQLLMMGEMGNFCSLLILDPAPEITAIADFHENL